MLSLGQLVEEGHDVEPRVLQQPEPQGCRRRGGQGQGPSCPPQPQGSFPFPSPTLLRSRHTLTGVFQFLHIPAIFEVLAQVASGK